MNQFFFGLKKSLRPKWYTIESVITDISSPIYMQNTGVNGPPFPLKCEPQ